MVNSTVCTAKILCVLITGIFLSLVNISIINIALPSIKADIAASGAQIQWMVSGYTLVFGVTLIIGGRLGDVYSYSRIFIIGTIVFTLCSLICGFAIDPSHIVVARLIQGVGSSLMIPQAFALVQNHFSDGGRAKAFGWFGVAVGVSVAIGPVLGGLLVEFNSLTHGWRLSFLVNVPVGVLVTILASVWLPRTNIDNGIEECDDTRSLQNRSLRHLDPFGCLLLTLPLCIMMYTLIEFELTGSTAIYLLVAVLLGIGFYKWQIRVRKLNERPLIDLNSFRDRSFLFGNIILVLYFMGTTNLWLLLALYIQEGLGRSALISGAIEISPALISAVVANWAGRKLVGYRWNIVICGVLLGIVGMISSAIYSVLYEYVDLSLWWLFCCLGFIGGAQGAVITPSQTLILANVPPTYGGSSSGIMQTGQRIGDSIGLALIVSISLAVSQKLGWSYAFGIGLGINTGIYLIALGVAVVCRRRDESDNMIA